MKAGRRSSNPKIASFSDDLKARSSARTAPNRVSASKLDANFAAVTLIEPTDGSYRVQYDAGGTMLLDINSLPEGAVARAFNVCDNGSPKTYYLLTWDSDPQL